MSGQLQWKALQDRQVMPRNRNMTCFLKGSLISTISNRPRFFRHRLLSPHLLPTTTLLVHLSHLCLHRLPILRSEVGLRGIRKQSSNRRAKKQEAEKAEEGVEVAVEDKDEGDKMKETSELSI
ncbi:unnamed protein product [Linum trigynum]|uniref:Uncharacterized protein n=1 Tax=Linum trigynum TaxID=586398 RepID=A0AAV2GL60_9ROSI